jgi:hypothetical protein
MSAYRSVLENVLDTADIVRDRDFSTIDNAMERSLCHPHANHPAETTAPKCSQVFPD